MKNNCFIFCVFILFVISLSSCKDNDPDIIIYPETFDGYLNVLNDDNSVFIAGYGGPPTSATPYSYLYAATEKWMSLKVKLEYIEGGQSATEFWKSSLAIGSNWTATPYDSLRHSQTFKVTESGIAADLKMWFPVGNGLKIRISYFENTDLVATKTKIITVN